MFCSQFLLSVISTALLSLNDVEVGYLFYCVVGSCPSYGIDDMHNGAFGSFRGSSDARVDCNHVEERKIRPQERLGLIYSPMRKRTEQKYQDKDRQDYFSFC